MKETIFSGSGVAIVTPFYEDGSINYEKLKELIKFQIDNKTDAVIVCGTTGESSTSTDEEHTKIIKIAVEKSAGRVPIIAGTGSNDTAYAIWLSQEAERAGADALLVVTPYYNKASQSGLIKHYQMIGDAVNLPIIVYNVPSRTGVNILPETYAELAKHENIVGVKEANGDLSALVRTMALCGDKLDVYSGNDDEITTFMSLGAKGIISVAANIVPRVIHEMANSYLQGNTKRSRELQLEYSDLCCAMFSDINPIPVKEAMNMMGLEVGPCRMPLSEMADDNKEKLRCILEQYKII